MPFIGNQPALSYTSFAKQDFTTSATTSYTLDNPVADENEIALFINFVRQEPTTAYTASGTSLTLTSATSASDDMYCVFLGKAVQTVTPPAGSVGTSQLVDSSVSLAKLSATGTKDATTFLRGDNTFAAAGLNGWSEDGANNNLLPASASAGIYLGVNSATASNLLDDYEEGSWTPSFGSSSGSFGSLTFTGSGGRYTKIGNTVTVWCRANCSTTNIGTASGQFEITGFPFSSSSVFDMYAGSAWRGGGAGPEPGNVQMLSNEAQASPTLNSTNQPLQVSNLASGGRNDFTITITYMVD